MEELINNKVFADSRQGVILQCNHCGSRQGSNWQGLFCNAITVVVDRAQVDRGYSAMQSLWKDLFLLRISKTELKRRSAIF